MRLKAAAEAMLTPTTAANTALPSTVATARRPGTRPIARLIVLYKSEAAPERAMNSPIRMNSGITANT